MQAKLDKVRGTLWRSLLVGAGYTSALVIGGLIIGLLGVSMPAAEDPMQSLFWSFVAGTIVGLFLGPVAASMPGTPKRHLIVWVSLFFFNIASVSIEGYFFAPEIIGDALLGVILQQIVAAIATSWLVTVLFASRETAAAAAPISRSILSWAWRFLAGTLVYLVFYFIIGGINYVLVTQPYYETHAGGLTVPEVDVVLVTEVIRGALITLSIIPFLLSIQANGKRQRFLVGMLLFGVGGLVPLTMQIGALPYFLLLASSWEIFFMNYFYGLILAHLLGRSDNSIPRENELAKESRTLAA